jgi:hypothetical protein
MTETLATLPQSQRATYSRIQAAVRSQFHADAAARRNAEFRARMAAVQAGGSLAPHARADPHSPEARKERYERLEKFIANWCTTGMPGTKPFFEGLWAVLRLQTLPESLGGAGARRIEWEIDDAVFKEAAGKDFMFEAVDVFKGVSRPFFQFDALSTNSSRTFPRFSASRMPQLLNGPNHGHDLVRRLACTQTTRGRALYHWRLAPSPPQRSRLRGAAPRVTRSLTPRPLVSPVP